MLGGERPDGEVEAKANQSPSLFRRGGPSQGFLLGVGGVLLLALFLTAVAAFAALTTGEGEGRDGVAPGAETPIPLEITVVPPEVTPDPDFAQNAPLPAAAPERHEPERPAAPEAPATDSRGRP